jgi:hypothetical protein
VATYSFYKGHSLQTVRYGSPGGRLRYIASQWVRGKPKRRVVIWTGSEHLVIRGSATGKDQ